RPHDRGGHARAGPRRTAATALRDQPNRAGLPRAPLRPGGRLMVRFAIDSWAAGIGSAFGGDDDLVQADGPVDVNVETPASDWAPVRPRVAPVEEVRFVDGTIRTDAIVWVTDDTGSTRQGRA